MKTESHRVKTLILERHPTRPASLSVLSPSHWTRVPPGAHLPWAHALRRPPCRLENAGLHPVRVRLLRESKALFRTDTHRRPVWMALLPMETLNRQPNPPLSDRAPGLYLSGWWERKKRRLHRCRGVRVWGWPPRSLNPIQTKMKMRTKHHLSRETLSRGFHPDPSRRRWSDWLRLHRSQKRHDLQTWPREPCSCWTKCPGREAYLRRSSRQRVLLVQEFPGRNLGASHQECLTGSTAGSTRPTKQGLHTVLLTWDTWTSTVRGACLRTGVRTVSQKSALEKSTSEGRSFIITQQDFQYSKRRGGYREN